ncbi:EAL domain-containing protein, partial [Thalassolituus sp. UBA1505]|uniref:EAL domain-containing protein n=2 Tax=unclassified Thalassolituus TaxID=2624967 RepID=UPI0025CE4868
DDFGTGYSSLAYLKQLPVDLVKIDASFVQDIPYNPDDLAIVRAIIGMARALNLEVLAEGVESAEQAACLNELGCHYLQGYFFSRPLVSKDVVTAVGSRESESI